MLGRNIHFSQDFDSSSSSDDDDDINDQFQDNDDDADDDKFDVFQKLCKSHQYSSSSSSDTSSECLTTTLLSTENSDDKTIPIVGDENRDQKFFKDFTEFIFVKTYESHLINEKAFFIKHQQPVMVACAPTVNACKMACRLGLIGTPKYSFSELLPKKYETGFWQGEPLITNNDSKLFPNINFDHVFLNSYPLYAETESDVDSRLTSFLCNVLVPTKVDCLSVLVIVVDEYIASRINVLRRRLNNLSKSINKNILKQHQQGDEPIFFDIELKESESVAILCERFNLNTTNEIKIEIG